jgi:hypothetical protein
MRRVPSTTFPRMIMLDLSAQTTSSSFSIIIKKPPDVQVIEMKVNGIVTLVA